MKDERIIHLVNGQLDGAISPSERDELTNLLEEDPSVRDLYMEMETLDQLLASVPLVEPPATLKTRVMNAIAHQEEPARSSARLGWLDRLLAPFVQRPAWAVAYAFVAGTIVGLGVLSIVQSTGPDPGLVHGTIMSRSPQSLGSVQISVGTTTADIVVTGMRDELRVDVALTSSDSATLRFELNGQDPIEIESGAGTPSYSIVLPNTSSIELILASGELTERSTLEIGERGKH